MPQNVDELKQRLSLHMEEHLECLRKESFVPADTEQLAANEKRLKEIREVSAGNLAEMARAHSQIGGEMHGR